MLPSNDPTFRYIYYQLVSCESAAVEAEKIAKERAETMRAYRLAIDNRGMTMDHGMKLRRVLNKEIPNLKRTDALSSSPAIRENAFAPPSYMAEIRQVFGSQSGLSPNVESAVYQIWLRSKLDFGIDDVEALSARWNVDGADLHAFVRKLSIHRKNVVIDTQYCPHCQCEVLDMPSHVRCDNHLAVIEFLFSLRNHERGENEVGSRIPGKSRSKAEAAEHKHVAESPRKLVDNWQNEEKRQHRELMASSSAEVLAEQAERGKYEVGSRIPGKSRSKAEALESKHVTESPRKLVDNWQNEEKRQHRELMASSSAEVLAEQAERGENEVGSRIPGKSRSKAEALESKHVTESPRKLVDNWQNEEKRQHRELMASSSAEVLAEQAERGKYEVGSRIPGKSRSKAEALESKHVTESPRKLVDNWQNEEKRQHRELMASSSAEVLAEQAERGENEVGSRIPGKSRSKAEALESKHVTESPRKLVDNWQNEEKRQHRELMASSSAEVLAEQAERGKYEVGSRIPGKSRSKAEAAEHKHVGKKARKLNDNWQNNEKRQHRDSK